MGSEMCIRDRVLPTIRPAALLRSRRTSRTAPKSHADLCTSQVVAGWADASSGPLIPYIQGASSTTSAGRSSRGLPPAVRILVQPGADHLMHAAHYKISYTVVSMMFVGQMVGFVAAGLMSSWLSTRFGLVRSLSQTRALSATLYTHAPTRNSRARRAR